MTINNDRDLRVAYEILSILNDKAILNAATDPQKLADHIKHIKRTVREYRDRPRSQAQIVENLGDYMVVVLPLPATLKGKDDADAYFLNNYYQEAYPSAYDCTGQIFTSWYKIFERRGQFWAYHATAMDV